MNNNLEKEILAGGGSDEEKLVALRNLHDSDMMDLIAWMAVRVHPSRPPQRGGEMQTAKYTYIYEYDGVTQQIEDIGVLLRLFKMDMEKTAG
jgi:hypothetical protein